MNSKYQSGEKININKIFFEDNFIDLINKLVKTISDYYHLSLGLISKSSNIIPLLESNINTIVLLTEKNKNNPYFNNNNQELSQILKNLNYIKNEFKLITVKTDDNLKSFFEKANIIFKEMKEKKNDKLEEVIQDFARKNNLKIKDQSDNSNLENIEPFRLSYYSKESSGSKNQKKERNKTSNKIIINNKNNSLHNFSIIKNLINKMGEYNNIISNYSFEAKDNYLKLQKQLLFEINKTINNNSSKSVERKNIMKTNTIPTYNTNNNNINNNNPFIMLNNNNNNNITMTTTNNNSYYNIIDKDNLKDLKNQNSNRNNKLENYINNNKDLKNEIKNLKTELENLKNINKSLENKIEESNNNIDIIKKNDKNKFNKYKNDLEIKIKSLENQNNELKKEYTLLLKKYNKENLNKDTSIGVVTNLEENNMDKMDNNNNNNEIKKLKEDFENKKNEYELNIKKLNEEMTNSKKENEQKLKQLNDENTKLSKYLADKSREIQNLQNSNKLKTNELNKLKLIVKTNEKQLKVKKLKAERQKANSPNIKIRDLLANSRNIYDNNDLNMNSSNISANHDKNENSKEIIAKLELEISKLKEELEKGKEEKESLTSNISVLEKDIDDKNKKNEILENELNNKNNEIQDENKIVNELKLEKERLIQKLKEYKNIEELNLSQIKILKNHIKEIEKHQNNESDNNQNKKNKKKELKKKISELEIEIANIKIKYDIELNNNEHLKNEVKNKTEQIDALNIVVKKLMEEKELYTLKKSPSLPQNNNAPIQNNVNRSKTNGDIEFNKINKVSNKDVNIKNIMNENDNNNNNNESNKDINLKKQNILNRKEYKTEKKLEIYNSNEKDSYNKKNDITKSEDAKLEYSNNNNKQKS